MTPETLEQAFENLAFIPSDASGVLVLHAPEGVLHNVQTATQFVHAAETHIHKTCPGVNVLLLRFGVEARLKLEDESTTDTRQPERS